MRLHVHSQFLVWIDASPHVRSKISATPVRLVCDLTRDILIFSKKKKTACGQGGADSRRAIPVVEEQVPIVGVPVQVCLGGGGAWAPSCRSRELLFSWN